MRFINDALEIVTGTKIIMIIVLLSSGLFSLFIFAPDTINCVFAYDPFPVSFCAVLVSPKLSVLSRCAVLSSF